MTYLITFACYGCHLHGDESGSVDREHHLPGSRLVDADPKRVLAERQRMDQPAYGMDQSRREAVLAAIRERCADLRWSLLAAHVRTNHVHVVVDADVQPERIMTDLKAYSSRSLNRLGLDEPTRKRWARHGSTRWLWEAQSVSAAIRYVVDEQGMRWRCSRRLSSDRSLWSRLGNKASGNRDRASAAATSARRL